VIKPGGTVPVDGLKDVSYTFERCTRCNAGWTKAHKNTVYRLYQVSDAKGQKKWRAKPI
jgi:predicted phage gp36 major capsid-like protein